MYVSSLAPERLDVIHNRYFKGLSIMSRCSVNINTVTPKIEAFQMGAKNKFVISSKTAVTILIKFQ
jgi:hypothetical protein